MIITTLEYVPGKTITKHLGLVQGSTVRAKHVGKDILAGIKNVFGGELKAYTELLQESREEAIERTGPGNGCKCRPQCPLFYLLDQSGGLGNFYLWHRRGSGLNTH